jgi:hypothetical protein
VHLSWLALYSFEVLGYVTAMLSNLFVGRKAGPGVASAKSIEAQRVEIAGLRCEIRALSRE